MPSESEDLSLSRVYRLTGDSATPLDYFGEALDGAPAGHSAGTAAKIGAEWLQHSALIDGKYKVLARLGSGGMGAVYQVRHIQLQRDEALKTLKKRDLDMDLWQRFQREAQAIAKLNCLQIVHVFDFGIGEKNVPFYTMELLDGQSLAEKIKLHGALRQSQALSYFEQVARGLMHAHNMDVVHRDIKPANIFVCNPDRAGKEIVKLVDFGIAKLATGNDLDSQRLTSTGFVFGSPLYMSPEQSLGNPLDAKSDQYSFGCSLYHALTGTPPFSGRNAFATMLMHQNQKPRRLSQSLPRGQFSDRMEALVARLLAKDPEARYPSFAEILDELNLIIQQGEEDPRVPPPPVSWRTASMSGAGEQTTGSISIEINRKKKIFRLVAAIVLFIVTATASVILAPSFTRSPAKKPTVVEESDFHPWSALDHYDKATVSSAHEQTKPLPDLPEYYSVVGPAGQKQFVFPPGIELGEFELSLPHQRRASRCKARGTVDLPANATVHLTAGAAVYAHPELLSHFKSDDLFALRFDPEFEWTDKHLAQIRHFKNLAKLQLEAVTLNPSVFGSLDELSKLVILELPGCKADARELLKLKGLKTLEQLHVDGGSNAPALIKGLVGDKHILDLSFTGCALTDSDMQDIAKIKNLTILRIGQNPAITAAGLAHLTTMPQLKSLDIRESRMGPECISVLRQMKSLTELRISDGSWTAGQRAALITALPRSIEINKDNSSDDDD